MKAFSATARRASANFTGSDKNAVSFKCATAIGSESDLQSTCEWLTTMMLALCCQYLLQTVELNAVFYVWCVCVATSCRNFYAEVVPM